MSNLQYNCMMQVAKWNQAHMKPKFSLMPHKTAAAIRKMPILRHISITQHYLFTTYYSRYMQ